METNKPRRMFLKSAVMLPAATFLGGLYQSGIPNLKRESKSWASIEDIKNTSLGDYTFSSFFETPNNSFAYKMSQYVANFPGEKCFNPLHICGPNGMGKTHLLRAIQNHINVNRPDMRIQYVTGEQYLNDCISSIRRNDMANFRKRYRENCDVLLMDYMHIIGRGEAIQEEFLFILNHYIEQGKQVVVVSDVSFPNEIAGLNKRIRSIIDGGCVAEIQMPDIYTRSAILRHKARVDNVKLDDQIIEFVAQKSARSIRQMEGNLHRVIAFADLHQQPITMQLTKSVLKNI